MGSVFLARDGGREVALKVLNTADFNPNQLERFSREAQLTASLAHPNVVRVHDAGVSGRTPYIVYELVEGAQTLEEALPRLPRAERIRLILETARGLAVAHAQGIVHRDVKPDNVLVAAGHAKVADFGLCTATDLDRLTVTGALVGTPRYMAPEQVAGERAGPQVDVWALGVMLYEALTDSVPFDGVSLPLLIGQIAVSPITPPRKLDPTIPPELEAVVLRAMERNREQRFADGQAFADALAAAQNAAPGSKSRARPVLALVALGVFALAGGLVLASESKATAEAAAPSLTPTPSASLAPPLDLPRWSLDVGETYPWELSVVATVNHPHRRPEVYKVLLTGATVVREAGPPARVSARITRALTSQTNINPKKEPMTWDSLKGPQLVGMRAAVGKQISYRISPQGRVELLSGKLFEAITDATEPAQRGMARTVLVLLQDPVLEHYLNATHHVLPETPSLSWTHEQVIYFWPAQPNEARLVISLDCRLEDGQLRGELSGWKQLPTNTDATIKDVPTGALEATFKDGRLLESTLDLEALVDQPKGSHQAECVWRYREMGR
jgi:serine/threonine protein kinase